MEMFTAPDGSVGIEAFKRYYPEQFKGKKHRYNGSNQHARKVQTDF